MNLILYGPPAVGKTTVGRLIAGRLGREFVDGDAWIEARWGRPVPDYFQRGEEALFRAREAEACRAWSAHDDLVIAPGGGALLDPHSRAALEAAGVVICLSASSETLLTRLDGHAERPLLTGDREERLAALLREREPLYRSFALQVNTDGRPVEAVAEAVIAQFRSAEGVARFELNGHPALMGHGLLARLPEFLTEQDLHPPYVVITDAGVAPLYGGVVRAALASPPAMGRGGEVIPFPAGEAHKTLDTVRALYSACLAHGLERGGTVLALGGGVVGDVAGFVAATFMRGVRWVNLPTTVLAMADASLGGKVGVDLPEGKNLVGAFHPPALVVADFDTLTTLPVVEVRCGLAEVVKAAVIGDPDLFARLSALPPVGGIPEGAAAEGKPEIEAAIVRAAAVKVGIVNADPFERGERARLNFGHTIGHGVEAASAYRLRHGEAIAIGMVAEARLAEAMGLAEHGLSERIANCLRQLGLLIRCAGPRPDEIRGAMEADKKKSGGRLKFALPKRIGEVVWGVEADDALLPTVLESLADG